MSDRFEDFVKNNAESFDMLEPREDLWEGVDRKLEQKKRFNLRLITTRVAAVAAIFIVSFMIQKVFINGNFKLPLQQAKVEIPEVQEAELYYNQVIQIKLEEVKPLLSKHPYLAEILDTDLNDLEDIYEELKNDLKDNIANHEVIEEMIENYQRRIQVLEEMAGFLTEKEENIEETKNTRYDL